jgi:hypothetical protein
LPSSQPMSDRKPNDARAAIIAWSKLRTLMRGLSQTIGRHAAMQIE